MGQDPTKYVYTFEQVEVEVGGVPYNVAGFTLALQHNGIPTLQVIIDPSHVYNEPELPAVVASVYNFITTYNQLQEALESEARRTTSFFFTAESSDGDVQNLNLQGWILTGAGFDGLGANGQLQLSLEVRHPAWKAGESSINFYGFGGDPEAERDTLLDFLNIYEGIVGLLELYLDTADSALVDMGTNNVHYTESVTRGRDMIQAMRDHFKWAEGPGWPDAPFTTLKNEVPLTLWGYIYGIESLTPLNFLITELMSDYSMSLRPTFWDAKLLLEPYKPWAEPLITLFDTDVTSFRLPAKDGMPVCGRSILMPQDRAGAYTSTAYAEGQQIVLRDAAIWFEHELRGTVQTSAIPRWYRALLETRSSEYGGGSYPEPKNVRDNTPYNTAIASGGAGDVDTQDLLDFYDGMIIVAKQLFTEQFRREYEITANCRLLIQSDHSSLEQGYVTPGCVYTFKNATDTFGETGELPGGQGTFLSFFVSQVMHVVDCNQKIAMTQLYGSYLRRDGGPNLQSIEAGVAPNYLYDDSSSGGSGGSESGGDTEGA